MQSYTRINIDKTKDGFLHAVIENDKILFELCSVGGWGAAEDKHGQYHINAITRLCVKKEDGGTVDVISGKSVLDVGAHGKEFSEIKLICDESGKKIVHTVADRFEGPQTVRDFTITAGSNVIKIDYQSYYVNVWELIDWEKGVPDRSKYAYAIYGSENWKRSVDTFHERSYYIALVGDANMPDLTEPDDPSSISYKGHFIVGLYEVATGLGYGRVVAAEHIDVLKLLWNHGLEFFPYFKKFMSGGERTPFSMYLYPVSGGADEIIRTGKQIIDVL
jgi:hypothetical protein